MSLRTFSFKGGAPNQDIAFLRLEAGENIQQLLDALPAIALLHGFVSITPVTTAEYKEYLSMSTFHCQWVVTVDEIAGGPSTGWMNKKKSAINFSDRSSVLPNSHHLVVRVTLKK